MPESQHSRVSPIVIESPACAKCQAPMILTSIRSGRLNFDLRTFECVRCAHVMKSVVAADPMQSDLLGWLFGELGPPLRRLEKFEEKRPARR
jgi:hypothetical protein